MTGNNDEGRVPWWVAEGEPEPEPYPPEVAARLAAELAGMSEPRHEQPIPSQSRDGRPHLAYFIRERGLSFVWSGEPNEMIEVCEGGYGEPPTWGVSPRMLEEVTGLKLAQMYDASVLLAAFKRACDAWARTSTG